MLAFKKNTTLFNVRHRKTCIILSDFIEFDLSQRTKLKGLMERGTTSIFQRSRSIEKNNVVFLLFTNCTILKKAKKSPFLALTLFDHVPKRKSGICYSFNGGQSRLMYQRLVPIWYTNVVPINSHNAILQITTKL